MSELSDSIKAQVLTAARFPIYRNTPARSWWSNTAATPWCAPNSSGAVMSDIILLSLVGIKVVLVHGGGPDISAMLKRLGHRIALYHGRAALHRRRNGSGGADGALREDEQRPGLAHRRAGRQGQWACAASTAGNDPRQGSFRPRRIWALWGISRMWILPPFKRRCKTATSPSSPRWAWTRRALYTTSTTDYSRRSHRLRPAGGEHPHAHRHPRADEGYFR